MSNSILDQVMTAQKMSAITNFSPTELAGKLFSVLNERERDIIAKRYGLSGSDKSTLEEIGATYNVTRERIRQIENSSLKKIRESFDQSTLKEFEVLINGLLDDHGEIMAEERLLNNLLAQSDINDESKSLLRFLLHKLMADRFAVVKESSDVYTAWSNVQTDWNRYTSIISAVVEILKAKNDPISLDQLITEARGHSNINLPEEKFDIIVVNYLDITKLIEENRFNEWGLSHWNSIRPKRMNDKIYLILKKHKKPLHFVDIASKINDAKFDSRVAYPATIHNELILDKKYVLVGRGIYALKDWGYKPGVVIEVITDVLKEADKPLSRNEIIEKVLEKRMVKQSTVVLALMNKDLFQKDGKGKYSLAS